MYAAPKLRQFRVANDIMPTRTVSRRVPIYIVRQRSNPIWHVFAGLCLLLSFCLMVATIGLLTRHPAPSFALWMPAPKQLVIPFQKSVTPSPAPTTIAIVPKAIPTVVVAEMQPKSVPTEQPDTAFDITLPASSLSQPDQALAKITSSIATLPTLKEKSQLHISSTDFDEPDSLLSRAQTLLEAGKYGEALNLYDRLLASDRTNIEALTGKIYALAKKGALSEAIKTSRTLLKTYPHDDKAEANLAQLLSQSGRYDEAITHLDRAVRQAPDHLAYRLDLAALYDRSNHPAEALMLYKQVLTTAEHEDIFNLVVPHIQQRVDYLERLELTASDPSTTRPDATK